MKEPPPNNTPEKYFTLYADIYQGSELPVQEKAYIHVSIGKEFITTHHAEVKYGRATWMESIKPKKVLLPDD